MCHYHDKILVDLYVSINILRADKCIIEHINEAGNDNPVATDIAYIVSNKTLNEWKDTTTANKGHKDT